MLSQVTRTSNNNGFADPIVKQAQVVSTNQNNYSEGLLFMCCGCLLWKTIYCDNDCDDSEGTKSSGL